MSFWQIVMLMLWFAMVVVYVWAIVAAGVQVWVDSSDKRQFERHLRKHLKDGLEAAGVSHPNRGVEVWLHETDAV